MVAPGCGCTRGVASRFVFPFARPREYISERLIFEVNEEIDEQTQLERAYRFSGG